MTGRIFSLFMCCTTRMSDTSPWSSSLPADSAYDSRWGSRSMDRYFINDARLIKPRLRPAYHSLMTCMVPGNNVHAMARFNGLMMKYADSDAPHIALNYKNFDVRDSYLYRSKCSLTQLLLQLFSKRYSFSHHENLLLCQCQPAPKHSWGVEHLWETNQCLHMVSCTWWLYMYEQYEWRYQYVSHYYLSIDL